MTDVEKPPKALEVRQKTKRRPARIQLDPASVAADSKPEQSGQTFNLWYSKWSGGETNGRAQLTHAKTRCHVERDAGYTRADKNIGSDTPNSSKFVCLYFARGCCCNGKNCDYLHRLPGELDFFPATLDCFGRDKFADYRDDMAGVGSFNTVNRTLYVGRLHSTEGKIELLVNKNFSEFGRVERVRVLRDKKVAFVTYKLESQAQFAKEAMHGQSLIESNEVEALNIRWANEDPDPVARKRQREELDEIALETAKKLLGKLEQGQHERSELAQRAKMTKFEEPVEEPVTVPLIESTPANPPSLIKNTSLHVLGKLHQKPQSQPQDLQSTLAGYDSDDE